jgi:hypothetical protein
VVDGRGKISALQHSVARSLVIVMKHIQRCINDRLYLSELPLALHRRVARQRDGRRLRCASAAAGAGATASAICAARRWQYWPQCRMHGQGQRAAGSNTRCHIARRQSLGVDYTTTTVVVRGKTGKTLHRARARTRTHEVNNTCHTLKQIESSREDCITDHLRAAARYVLTSAQCSARGVPTYATASAAGVQFCSQREGLGQFRYTHSATC